MKFFFVIRWTFSIYIKQLACEIVWLGNVNNDKSRRLMHVVSLAHLWIGEKSDVVEKQQVRNRVLSVLLSTSCIVKLTLVDGVEFAAIQSIRLNRCVGYLSGQMRAEVWVVRLSYLRLGGGQIPGLQSKDKLIETRTIRLKVKSHQGWNSWTAFLVEVSGHKLETSQTQVFSIKQHMFLSYLVSNRLRALFWMDLAIIRFGK